jgi:hypothetical protein
MTFRRAHAFGAGAAAAAALAGFLVWLWPAHRIAPERHLAATERLSDAARAALKTQMHSHARGMLELVSTATLLDYDGALAATHQLLAEPRLARPITRDATELNATLPPRFFDLQDALYSHLQEIRSASEARMPDALATGLAAATRTCVQCHDAYLHGK